MTLNIEISDKYRITSDSTQIIVQRKHHVDPTLSPAYDADKHSSETREDVPALVAEVERLRAELEDIIAVATEEAACLSYESGYEDIVKIANDALK